MLLQGDLNDQSLAKWQETIICISGKFQDLSSGEQVYMMLSMLQPGCVARTYTHLLVDDDFFDESMRCSTQHAYCYYCLNKQEELKASVS